MRPPDAGGRDDAARRGQAVLVGRLVDLAPQAAAANPNRTSLRIDLNVLHEREIGDHSAVAGAQPGAVVAAASHCQEQIVVAGKGDDLRDVVGPLAARDQRRPLVDHRVVDLARLAEVGVVGCDQLSAQP